MRRIAKKTLMTFALGGVTGVVGQLLVMLFAGLGFDGLALPMAVLFTMGLLGCIMVITGIADKLGRTGSSVVLVAFYGLSMAMAQAYMGIRSSGAAFGRAFTGTWRFFAMALIPGIVIAVLCGVIAGPMPLEPVLGAAELPAVPGIIFVAAFVCCGAICAVAQLLLAAFRKITPPVLLNLFLALGGILTPCGFMTWLDSVGGGGSLVAIDAAGNAFQTAGTLLAAGMPSMLITILVLFAVTTLLGMLAGETRIRLEKRRRAGQEKPEAVQSDLAEPACAR